MPIIWVHPSPFSSPTVFGGLDRLTVLYRLDLNIAEYAAFLVCNIIIRIHNHINNTSKDIPAWLEELKNQVKSEGTILFPVIHQ